MQTTERLDVLDGFRGLAIILVVLYHGWLVSGQALGPFNFIAEAGFLGVELFFFISGFCLYAPYARAEFEGGQPPRTFRFFERRARKIVPSYLLAIAVFTIVYRDHFSSAADGAIAVIAHLAFLQTVSTSTFGSISGPLWTIGIEVQFYTIFPLIAIGFRRSPLVAYLVLVAVSEAYRLVIGAVGAGTSFLWINQLPAFLDVFGAGMFAAHGLLWLRARYGGGSIVAGSSAVAVAAFGLAVVGLATASHVGLTASVDAAHTWLNGHRVLIGPLCLVLALSTACGFKALRVVLVSKPLFFLSMISYNLYLWHLEIMVWFRNAGLSGSQLYVQSILAAIAFSTLVTVWLEQPLLRTDLSILPATWQRLTHWSRRLRQHGPHATRARALPLAYQGFATVDPAAVRVAVTVTGDLPPRGAAGFGWAGIRPNDGRVAISGEPSTAACEPLPALPPRFL